MGFKGNTFKTFPGAHRALHIERGGPAGIFYSAGAPEGRRRVGVPPAGGGWAWDAGAARERSNGARKIWVTHGHLGGPPRGGCPGCVHLPTV